MNESDPLQYSLEHMREQGLRITPQRTDILQALIKRRNRVSVRQIFDQVRKKHPGISMDTVYRTLGTFANIGLVSQIHLHAGGDLHYEFQGQHHHHHAICLDCGASVCLEECPLPASFFEELKKQNFTVVNHAFEVYGHCARCR